MREYEPAPGTAMACEFGWWEGGQYVGNTRAIAAGGDTHSATWQHTGISWKGDLPINDQPRYICEHHLIELTRSSPIGRVILAISDL